MTVDFLLLERPVRKLFVVSPQRDESRHVDQSEISRLRLPGLAVVRVDEGKLE